MKILTIKRFEDLLEVNYDGTAPSELDANTIALLTNTPSSDIKKLKVSDYTKLKQELLGQLVAGTPVSMFYFKGKLFGYEPPEIDTVEAMIAMEHFVNTKNWNALCALLFREVKPVSRFWWRNRKHFTKRLGLHVREISNFSKEKLTYSVKKLDFSKVDLEFWDDFPVNILMSNLGFSIGSGLRSSLSIPPSSLLSSKKLIEVNEELQEKIQELICFSLLQNTVLGLECLSSTETNQSSTPNQESYLIGLSTSAKSSLKNKINRLAWVLSGKQNQSIIDSFSNLIESICNKKVSSNDVILLSNIGQINNRDTKIGLLWQK